MSLVPDDNTTPLERAQVSFARLGWGSGHGDDWELRRIQTAALLSIAESLERLIPTAPIVDLDEHRDPA
ncbi:MAG TPA: hypothetical protein VLL25_12145 [Acidimicrobiales bacterium]|nr:hypothetical protein [Acidimicrobiales bacterium]